ncbi:MotA/TolQ/ExbB proton channel family protein [Planctomycetales bacterium ZRK34]|nr:MotA/TolQ/ExbB proton channel family protein [Planctomycetales bacterium ZRK34]
MRSAISRSGFAAAAVAGLMMTAATPAFAQAQQSSVFKMFFWSDNLTGVIITWALILMSVCVMALVIKHVMDNRMSNIMPEDTVLMYEEMLQEKRFREAIEQAADDPSTFGQIVHASLSEAANGYGAMERAIEETTDLLGSKRVRAVEVLNVLGAVGPMVGLFGTIYGMIVAFQVIVDKGGQPDPAELAGGISTALVTTFWGLIVGIPAVAAGALVRNKIDGIMVEVMIRAEMLISQFQPGAKKGAKPAAAAASAESSKPKPRPE